MPTIKELNKNNNVAENSIFYKLVFDKRLRIPRHISFWCALYFNEIVFAITNPSANQPFLALKIFIDALVNGLLVALNIYILLPRYLQQKKYVSYFGIMGSIIVFSGLFPYFLYTLCEDCGSHLNFWSFCVYNATNSSIIHFAASGIKLFKTWYSNQGRIKALQEEKFKAELKYLKIQVNPHFLFNSLNNILVMHKLNHENTEEAIHQLSDLLKYQIYDCSKDKVKLIEEIKYLQNLINLEKIRKSDLAVNFDINAETSVENKVIEPLLFTPLLENAIKHGRKNSNSNYINLTLSIREYSISFSVENSKSKLYTPKEVGGIGISNLKKRLSLVYPNMHEFKIEENDDFYRASLKLFER